jgi:hypothetical protein
VAAQALLAKGGTFAAVWLRDCPAECQAVGRDLVRVLRDAAQRVPELEAPWASLHTRGAGLSQLLATRSNHRFLQNRLTPEMEAQLKFVLTQVGAHAHSGSVSASSVDYWLGGQK